MIIKPSKRAQTVREYYFSRKLREIAKLNDDRERQGLPGIINLGIGAPDGMPPSGTIEEMHNDACRYDAHKYQSYIGTTQLREAFAAWYKRYYNVTLDPSTQVRPLFGSKEGILLISLAFLDEGDKVLVPDPGYPTYSSASRLAGAEVLTYGLSSDNGWYPDFESLEKRNLDGVRIMWVNYPHMPTGALPTIGLYDRLVDFALRHGILLVNDNPYSFILNDNPLSILSADRAFECCIELNSLSKSYNMSGWRIGMAAGDTDLLSELVRVKSQMDSGMFRPMQVAAAKALSQGPEWFRQLNEEYSRRRDAARKIFDLLGIRYETSSARGGMFLWGKVEDNDRLQSIAGNPLESSCVPQSHGFMSGAVCKTDDDNCTGARLSDWILYNAGVFITPGFIFGKNGRDYVRISLCSDIQTLSEAARRIAGLMN